jgi:hypothetical protein
VTEVATTVVSMLGMSRRQLDLIFHDHEAGDIPRGEGHGTVLVRWGGTLSTLISKVVHRLAWQGKVFDPEKGELRNEISPDSVKAVRAKVYEAPSWFDQKPCIVLDYSHTSLVAKWIRDEIREVSPGVYLGIVFVRRWKTIDFALEFPAR